ncbi:MAG: NADH-quinone oxidoreductase subunit NuoK [Candidatus Eisenbacteria bacterium]|nr:NADH-quinone oxidoreductase subunit NuoK [Candidatus Eisenbacteria bacterium]
MTPLSQYLALGAVVFVIGLFGVLTRRNAIGILISIEIMLGAVNLNLVAFSRFVETSTLNGQVFSVFVMTVAAGEAAVGLALILALYKSIKAVFADKFNILRW